MKVANVAVGAFLSAALVGCGAENERKSSIDVKVNGKSAVKVETKRTSDDDDRNKKTSVDIDIGKKSGVDVDVKTSKSP